MGDLAKAGKVKKDWNIINNAIEAANKSNKDFVTFIQGRGKNAKSVTVELPNGFRKIKQKTHDGMPVYTNGKKYITPDKDGHKGGEYGKWRILLRNLGAKQRETGHMMRI